MFGERSWRVLWRPIQAFAVARVEVRRRAAAEIWLWPGLPVPATRALRDVLPPISLPTPLTTAALLAAIDAAAMRVGAA